MFYLLDEFLPSENTNNSRTITIARRTVVEIVSLHISTSNLQNKYLEIYEQIGIFYIVSIKEGRKMPVKLINRQ